MWLKESKFGYWMAWRMEEKKWQSRDDEFLLGFHHPPPRKNSSFLPLQLHLQLTDSERKWTKEQDNSESRLWTSTFTAYKQISGREKRTKHEMSADSKNARSINRPKLGSYCRSYYYFASLFLLSPVVLADRRIHIVLGGSNPSIQPTYEHILSSFLNF